MKCLYCDKICKKQRNPDINKEHIRNKWICLNHGECWLVYQYDMEDKELLWLYYSVMEGTIQYSMKINYVDSTFKVLMFDDETIDEIQVLTNNGNVQKAYALTEVVKLDFIPDITPLNFKEKLPTILTFL